MQLDLVIGNYKLVNVNEFNIDRVHLKQKRMYEIRGIRGKLLFVDLKLCYGDVNINFYQGSMNNISSKKPSDHKTIKNGNLFTHYIKMD